MLLELLIFKYHTAALLAHVLMSDILGDWATAGFMRLMVLAVEDVLDGSDGLALVDLVLLVIG